MLFLSALLYLYASFVENSVERIIVGVLCSPSIVRFTVGSRCIVVKPSVGGI